MNTVKQHFETVIITSMIAKQEVIIQCLDGEVVKGFSVGEHYVHWDTISKIELTDRYFEFWQELLPEGNDAFDK
ncbi:hypothetical protein D920_00387 [Enterococcus faecalis 13-SD-W-01]|nr:hypothetical protein D920_00387 [Enterococcus faecalis 13-SD-W-01]